MAMTPTTTPAAIASVELVVFVPGTTKNYKELMHKFITFFLGTGVLRHSTYHLQCAYTSNRTREFYQTYYIHTYIYIYRSKFSANTFIALKCHSEMIMGFAYEYTYQEHENIIRTMNTKHAQGVTKPYTYGFSCPRQHTQLHRVVL